MDLMINAIDISGDKIERHFRIEVPFACPYCVKGAFPKHLISYYNEPRFQNFPVVTALFLCPICEKLFLATYQDISEYELSLCSVIPYPSKEKGFSDNIKSLSPDFCKIYNESYRAEQQGLTEICGMGYRKALEFLIKDYAISLNPNNSEEIKRKMLGQCINDYMENDKLKALARASSWLGNDETHYVRQNIDYSLKDLKNFISATVDFIDMELTIKEAQNFTNR